MTTRHAPFLLAIVATLSIAAIGVQAQVTKPSAPASIAGKWTMNLETPHGKIATTMELKVDGKKVTGTFTSDHTGKAAVAGEFVDNRLTWKATEGDLSFTAKLKDPDTLAGVLSTERGDLEGTATRVKKT